MFIKTISPTMFRSSFTFFFLALIGGMFYSCGWVAGLLCVGKFLAVAAVLGLLLYYFAIPRKAQPGNAVKS